MRRLLFVELLGGIGDLVLALPAVHALARTHPGVRTTVLTFDPGAQLLAHDPLVHDVVVARRGPPHVQAQQVAAVLRRGFDLVVSDTRYGGIPELIDASGAARTVTDLWRSPPPHELADRRFLRILAEEGLVAADLVDLPPRLVLAHHDAAWAAAWVGRWPSPYGRLVALVLEAGMAIKEWGDERFAALARALTAEGVGVVVVSGGDPARAAALAERAGVAVAPPVPLPRLAALLARVDACVAADTGPARVAGAVGTPTVCLFGPTTSGRFGLRPEANRNLDSPLPCPVRNPANMTEQACWWSGRCVLAGHATCLDDIGVAAVRSAVRRLLAGARSSTLEG